MKEGRPPSQITLRKRAKNLEAKYSKPWARWAYNPKWNKRFYARQIKLRNRRIASFEAED